MRNVPRAAARLGAIALALGLSACVYRMDVQQGNLLGTPMVIYSFDADRWDYVYSLRRGHERQVTRRHLVVWFDGDKVTRVEEPIPLPRPVSAATG